MAGNRRPGGRRRIALHRNGFRHPATTGRRRGASVYLRARYYDPATGQFLTRDPIAALTGSPYGYAGDNPLNLTDPTGFMVCAPDGPCGSTQAVDTRMANNPAAGPGLPSLQAPEPQAECPPTPSGCAPALPSGFPVPCSGPSPLQKLMGVVHAITGNPIVQVIVKAAGKVFTCLKGAGPVAVYGGASGCAEGVLSRGVGPPGSGFVAVQVLAA
ncbi:MAG: RHS repeat-associated core domain-containing protein [Mycobacteriales bacterium]